ncbi:replication initiator, partial [Streptomyces sp. L500]
APTFGPVHRVTPDGKPCRPRRDTGHCTHDRPVACHRSHTPTGPAAGQPLCPGCYDYTGHVLWHAHAGELWSRFTRAVRRHLATAAGIPQSRFGEHARLSFAKVAEYQRRAAVHVHAVVRLDGPTGPHTPPPPWGTPAALTTAIHAAARSVTVHSPYSPAIGDHELRWGAQLDVRPLNVLDRDHVDGLAYDAVAAYIAKYVTKSAADTSAGTDHPLTTRDDITAVPATPHVRTLMRTCWDLGGLPELRDLRLRAWAHTLGFRGHILTKSRVYSTTYTALRTARANHARPQPHDDQEVETTTETYWRYTGSGHTPGAALIAAGVAEDRAQSRQLYKEARQDDEQLYPQRQGRGPGL